MCLIYQNKVTKAKNYKIEQRKIRKEQRRKKQQRIPINQHNSSTKSVVINENNIFQFKLKQNTKILI